MRRLLRARRARAVVLAVASTGLVAGIAYSAWTISGTGTGYAKAATASPLTLGDATASTSADLFPGASANVTLKVTNSNSFPVKITAVTKTGAISSNKGAACDAATGLTFANQTGLSLAVAASTTATVTVPGLSMGNGSDDSCQGAVFTIPVSVAAISDAS